MALYSAATPPILHLLGDGTTTEFDITFPFLRQEDVEVYLGIEGKDSGIDYQLIGDNQDFLDGVGKIEFFTAPVDQIEITLIRNTTETRLTDFEAAAYFEERLLDGEFNNYLRMIEDSRLFLEATPHFHPKDIGTVDGLLPPTIPLGVLRVNAAGTGFDYVELGDLPEFNDAVARAKAEADRAEAQANIATASTTVCTDAAASATLSESNANTAYLGSEQAKVVSQDSAELSEKFAINPYGVDVEPNKKSALHWAEQARINANQSFVSGGSFDPSTGSEYPTVTGVVKDTIWIINIEATPNTHTFVGGDLNGVTVKSGDQLFYDTPTNTFSKLTVVQDFTTNDFFIGSSITLPSQTSLTRPDIIQRNGALLSRTAYPKLWQHAQDAGLVVTEVVWQDTATTTEGNAVDVYSSGDGSTTFRIPQDSLVGERVVGSERILQVNGGSNVTTSQRYAIDIATELGTDYISKDLIVQAEIYNNSGTGTAGWGNTGPVSYSPNQVYGVSAYTLNEDVVIQTGIQGLTQASVYDGNPFGNTTIITSAPCRVKVWLNSKLDTSKKNYIYTGNTHLTVETPPPAWLTQQQVHTSEIAIIETLLAKVELLTEDRNIDILPYSQAPRNGVVLDLPMHKGVQLTFSDFEYIRFYSGTVAETVFLMAGMTDLTQDVVQSYPNAWNIMVQGYDTRYATVVAGNSATHGGDTNTQMYITRNNNYGIVKIQGKLKRPVV